MKKLLIIAGLSVMLGLSGCEMDSGVTSDQSAASTVASKTEQSMAQSSKAKANANATTGQEEALESAKEYLDFATFSYQGLIEQLEYEGFSKEEAVYGVDNCGADWKEQAAKSAKDYLEISAFSHQGLIEQLEYEGFSKEEAAYGVDNCDANWREQAVKSAEENLEFSAFSYQGLIEQLEDACDIIEPTQEIQQYQGFQRVGS